MNREILTAALLLGALGLPVSAQAHFDGGGGGEQAAADGDWAVRDELKNPRLIQPRSPYGYDRSYSARPGALALSAGLPGGEAAATRHHALKLRVSAAI